MKYIYIALLILLSINVEAQVITEETIEYSYDNLNRLIHVIWEEGIEKMYVYDDVGNRTQLQRIGNLGINDEMLRSTITVYPNPASEFLNIQLPENIVSENTVVNLYDVNGRLIINQEYKMENREIRILVNNLSNGVYLLRITNNQQIWSQLFIKK